MWRHQPWDHLGWQRGSGTPVTHGPAVYSHKPSQAPSHPDSPILPNTGNKPSTVTQPNLELPVCPGPRGRAGGGHPKPPP